MKKIQQKPTMEFKCERCNIVANMNYCRLVHMHKEGEPYTLCMACKAHLDEQVSETKYRVIFEEGHELRS